MTSGASLKRRIPIACAAAVVAAGTLAAFGGGSANAQTADPYLSLTGTTTLSSDVLSYLDRLTPTGDVAGTDSMTIGVQLTRPDPSGEDAYLAQVYRAGSAQFRQFLSVPQWQQRFGVSQQRFDAALQWLHTGGLSTTADAGGTEYVLASGTAAQIETLLGVQLKTYTLDGVDLFANTSAPTVPTDLGVLGISGLENFTRMVTIQQIESQANHPAAPSHRSNGAATAASPNFGTTSPQDLWSIYDQPSNNGGQYEAMAIFGWGCTEPVGNPNDPNDPQNTSSCNGTDLVGTLRTDETNYSLPQMPIIISHYGTTSEPVSDTSGTGEWELDMPASTGMAPNADFEHLYFGNNGQDPDILAAYNAWNNDANGPLQGSSSFAGCEASPATGSLPGGPGNPIAGPGGLIIGNPNQDMYEATLKHTVELGRTMFNSAGDLGANGCPADVDAALNGLTPSPFALNNYPSSSDWVTTVGGTVLYWTGSGDTGPTPAQRFIEYAWPYSGGGTSLFIAAPSWQTGNFETDATSAPGVLGHCLVDWHGTPYPGAPATLCRGLPDVAAQSGDAISNGYFAGSGTSLSSPLWLGMWTRIQAASSNPGRLGFASPAIYANNATASKYEQDFFDIGGVLPTYNPGAINIETVPTCDFGIPGFSCSGSGWDYASGWGTPDVKNLMLSLDGQTSPVQSVAPTGLPEAPQTALILVAGLAGAVGIGTMRRRRLHRTPA